MITGRFPGQEEALRQRIEELVEEKVRVRANRRMFLGLAVGGIAGACAGGGAGYVLRDGDAPAVKPPVSSPELDKLRALAAKPFAELLPVAPGFVLSVGRLMPPGEDVIWVAVARLIHAAVERDPRADPLLDRLLATLSQRPGAPATMRPWFDLLSASRR